MSRRPLDPLSLALDAGGLIEASAGTGKTYTLVALYLRLLLEAGRELDQILVVTFTNAATEELRARIRKRLREALDGLDPGGVSDPALKALLARLPDPAAARRHLQDTLTRMDEAAIYTIHGFCQRMLLDNAFESGVAFDAEFVADESRLRRTAAADFWRRRVAAMNRIEARWLRTTWGTPDGLLDALAPLLRDPRIRVLPDPDTLAATADLASLARAFSALQAAWAADRSEVAKILTASPALNRRSYTANVVENALAAMDAISAGEMPLALPKGFERFTPETLVKQTKNGHATPTHTFFDRCGAFARDLGETLRALQVRFAADARTAIADALDRRKRRRQVLFFDDLLRRLDEALAGDGGPALAGAIRRRFPVTLIDEFQDTDPLQYRIFRRIYTGQADGALFLIGDPKQAIYSFRGADIFTYMRARDDAGEAHTHTLGTNWRSAAGLVEAVNTLFSQAPRPFVYDRHIPFAPVAPGPEADRRPLVVDAALPVPMRFLHIPGDDLPTTGKEGKVTAGAAREAAARACAAEIAGLLDLAGRGRARIGDDPLRAGDIAVLVRSHRDGLWMQESLRQHGVASVSLSQQSVFHTAEAEDLERVLQAVAEPNHEGRLRAALASGLMGWTADEILRLDRGDDDHERQLARFREYRELWVRRSFEVAFFALVDRERVCRRLRAAPDGERRLTNLLHLGELLQAASRQTAGTGGLLRWLADQRAGVEADDERLLRLESDEALVQIVTIHKSKGLEYPVVYLPFPWAGGAPGRKMVSFHQLRPPYPPFLDLGSDDIEAHRTLAFDEEMAERLRLFYVAVTRARQMCVLTWGRIHQAESSALARLLPRPAPMEEEADGRRDESLRSLEALAAAAGGTIAIGTASTEAAAVPPVSRETAPELAVREFAGRVNRDWRLTSYSGLLAGADAERPDYDPAPPAEAEPAATGPVDAVFRFPRGPGPGQCLHELLERLDFPLAAGPELDAAVDAQLARYAIDPAWRPAVTELVRRVLDTPLDDSGLRLRDIGKGDRRDEMEFHYPLARLTPGDLAAVLDGFAAYRGSADRLDFDPVQGLMKGFIDLVFRHDGRFYIVDYKSNHLGDRLEDYGDAALRAAMAAHHYDLQYLVYTVALHRHLARRLPGYRYETHFGGVFYLFLRGMHPERGKEGGVFYDRPALGAVKALDALFAGKGI